MSKLTIMSDTIRRKLISIAFEQRLHGIGNFLKDSGPACFVGYCWETEANFSLVHRLESHLQLAGVSTFIDHRDGQDSLLNHMERINSHGVDYVIFAMSKALMRRLSAPGKKTGIQLEIPRVIQRSLDLPETVVPILLDGNANMSIPKELHDIGYVDFREKGGYYFSVFKVLERLLPETNLAPYLEEFNKQRQAIQNSSSDLLRKKWETLKALEDQDLQLTEKIVSETTAILLEQTTTALQTRKKRLLGGEKSNKSLTRVWKSVAGILLISCVLGSYFMLPINLDHKLSMIVKSGPDIQELDSVNIRSDLLIPHDNQLLNRPKLLQKIDQKLTGSGIKTVALVGIGGSGKTTSAREYARQQNASVVWEVNADTHNNIARSFEGLAYALAPTPKSQQELKEIQNVETTDELEEKLLWFVKRRLQNYSDWVLIYDNVGAFPSIQKYFPHDSKTWGNGKVLITTRDGNIKNSSYINEKNIIRIKNLNKTEKFNLFSKILPGNSDKSAPAEKARMQNFLQEIPPFPLDVATAAYYIRDTGIFYQEYLKRIHLMGDDFEKDQKTLLTQVGNYKKTRYGLISLTLKEILKKHPNYEELFLLISLVDSQNIPKDLLKTHGKNVGIEQFIRTLRNHSFIVNEGLVRGVQTFSIQRSTQEIILNYLVKTLKIKKNSELMQSVAHSLEKYLAETLYVKNYSNKGILENHCEKFLTHNFLLTDPIKGSIRCELGGVYNYLNHYSKAKKMLGEGLKHLQVNNTARPLLYLGHVNRELGNSEAAKKSFEQSLELYKKQKNNLRQAQVLTYLGSVHRELGNYKLALDYVNQGISEYKKWLPEDHEDIAWAMVYLGRIHLELGNFETAKTYFEQSHAIYNQLYPKNHMWLAWAETHLGHSLNDIGNHKKAHTLLTRSLATYKSKYSRYSIDIVWILIYLGIVEKNLLNYQEAKNFLRHALKMAREKYGNNHTIMGKVLQELGHIYYLENNIKMAENLFNKALVVFQNNKHPEKYKTLEYLSDLFLQKAKQTQEDKRQAKNLKRQSIEYLKQSLEILCAHFPNDSPHIEKAQLKLQGSEKLNNKG